MNFIIQLKRIPEDQMANVFCVWYHNHGTMTIGSSLSNPRKGLEVLFLVGFGAGIYSSMLFGGKLDV